MSTDEQYAWNARVATRTLDGTAFILVDNRMVSLNEVGSHMWALFKDGATVSAVAHDVAEQFAEDPGTILSDTEEFVGELAQRGILVLRESSQPESMADRGDLT